MTSAASPNGMSGRVMGHPDHGMDGFVGAPDVDVGQYSGLSPQEQRAIASEQRAFYDRLNAFKATLNPNFADVVFNAPEDSPREYIEALKNFGFYNQLPSVDKQIALQEMKEERMRQFDAGHPFSTKGLISNVEGEMDLGMRTGILGSDR
jgi:hypothetical protein